MERWPWHDAAALKVLFAERVQRAVLEHFFHALKKHVRNFTPETLLFEQSMHSAT
jgi:hypothetical protein